MNRLSTALVNVAALLAPCTLLQAQWGPVQSATPPSARSEALLAYDLFGSRMLMLGGNFTDEFWSLENNTWTQLTPAVLPTARRRGNIGVDTFNSRILLYGGQDGISNTALDDTWQWDGSVWQQLAPSSTPGGLMWHGMAFDGTRNVTVVFGGRRNLWNPNEYLDETWTYSATLDRWTQVFSVLSPQPVLRPAMCFHPLTGQVITFGGENAMGIGTGETWTFDGSQWTQINTTGVTPPPRTGGQLAANFNRSVAVLFGGRDPVTFEILNDTWEHDGTEWREVSNVYGGIYPPRADFAMAHDLVRDRLVSFGGVLANNGLRNDTWEYGAQWQPFGLGCPGSAGIPTFTPGALPRIGGTATAEIGNVPAGIPFAFMAVGLSRTQWSLGSLPALLSGVGMPNCRTYTSADLLVGIPASNGIATWSWDVPGLSMFLGEVFYLQGITFDPGINPLGLAVSPAATLVIGN
jgi:hypothetical protein